MNVLHERSRLLTYGRLPHPESRGGSTRFFQSDVLVQQQQNIRERPPSCGDLWPMQDIILPVYADLAENPADGGGWWGQRPVCEHRAALWVLRTVSVQYW